MQITKIEPVGNTRKKYRIYLNDEPAFLLYGSEVRSYHLRENEEIDENSWQEITSAVLPKRAKLRCMHILKSFDKTEWQLRQKLKEGEYPDEAIDEAIAYVKSYGYVDDSRYAENYINSHRKSKSPQQMVMTLASKGISKEVISAAFEECEPVDATEQIRSWMTKKHFDPETADSDTERRFIQFLMRKGFGYREIKETFRH